ncbi:MAG: transcription termination/antitermination protein NusG [Balneolaceae bacterium]
MTSENSYDWYVVRCFSSHEKKVKEFLDREVVDQGLEDKIKSILIPTETVVEIRSGKKRTREKNFFPGYILVETIYDEEVNNLIQSAPSCLGFLKGGKNDVIPTPLKKSEVDRILGRVYDNQEMLEEGGVVDIPYNEGDLVKVIDGPFKDFDGTVQEVNTDKLKLRVLVSIFGRKTPVEVDVNQVEPAA